MTQSRVAIFYNNSDNSETQKKVMGELRTTQTGWIVKYRDDDGLVYLTKQLNMLKVVRVGEWKTSIPFDLGAETIGRVESNEGEIQLDIITYELEFEETGVSWKYSVNQQDQPFYLTYRWEIINE